MKNVKLKLDVMFKPFFINNQDLLKYFLSAILEIPYEEIENVSIVDPEIPSQYDREEFCYIDMLMNVSGKTIITVLKIVNDDNYDDNYKKNYNKIAFGEWCQAFTSGPNSDCPDSAIKKCVTINIIDFNLREHEDYHSMFSFFDTENNRRLTDKVEIHLFELKKVNPKPEPDDMRQIWLNLLNAETDEDFEMLKSMNIPEINKAIDIIYEMNKDEKIREMLRAREKMINDRASD